MKLKFFLAGLIVVVTSFCLNAQDLRKKGSLFASSIEQPIEKLTQKQKEIMLNGLLKLIYDLNKSGIITIQRMCFTCSNYQPENGIHYCKLLKSQLAENELRIDCPEHELQLCV